jgi:serine phosphatase RsbU (regulator of sigma subunit)
MILNSKTSAMKKLIFLLLFSVFISSGTFAQSQKIIKLEKQLKSSSGKKEIEILDKLSELCLDSDIDKSIKYAEKAVKKSKKTKVSDYILTSLYNTLGAAHYYKGNYSNSVKNYEKELNLSKKSATKKSIAKAYYNIAILCQKSGKKIKSEKNFLKSIEISEKYSYNNLLGLNYRSLAEFYKYYGRNDDAFKFLKKYIMLRDASYNTTQNILRKEIKEEKILREETEKVVEKLEEDTLKKSKEIEVLNIEKEIAEKLREQERQINESQQKLQQAEIKNQKIMNYVMAGVAVVVLIIGFIVFIGYIQKKKKNRMLVQKNSEIQQQKEEIETQNGLLQQQKEEITTQNEELEFQKEKLEDSHQHISASINYASRIQRAMLHGESVLEENFHQYFIIYEPRDIVSGDFYWVKKIRNFIAIVAADCTGHGVPGAFMSMLGISLLNEQVTSRRLDNPGEILDALRKKVKVYLKQTGKFEETKDGMDLALCLINIENLKAKYSGANNPLYIVRNKELIEYKPTRNPIGIYLKEKHFETHSIQLEKDDSIYLFSDGYVDQFGGEKGGKFKSKRFREILTRNIDNSMEEQKQNLEDEMSNWKAGFDQVDDILIMGIKV